jgi:hypothetical protein
MRATSMGLRSECLREDAAPFANFWVGLGGLNG